jgi:hypothetical protein
MRASMSFGRPAKQDVDGRDRPGHDGSYTLNFPVMPANAGIHVFLAAIQQA